MADRDRWDDERDERDERRDRRPPPRHERAYEEGGFAHAPRIGPTGIMNTGSPAGQWATTGRYFDDMDARANYGGFEGGPPMYGPSGPARRYAGIGRAPPANPSRRAFDDEPRSFRPAPEEGAHRGRGPKGYKRSDERIREDVSDRLTEDSHLDASDIVVLVEGCEVTLNGVVDSRQAKHRAEDCAESVTGVTHVQNNLRVSDRPRPGTLGAEVNPHVAAVSEGRDPDAGTRHMRRHDERRGER